MIWLVPIFLSVTFMLIHGGNADKAFLTKDAAPAGKPIDAAAAAVDVAASPQPRMIALSHSDGRVLTDGQVDDDQGIALGSAQASTATTHSIQAKAACESANIRGNVEVLSYWERVEICVPCVSLPQCGF
jgi:hypothetical protein